MDERLIEYIRKNLERGFSTNRIRQALLRAGYEINLVEEHIRHAAGPTIKKYLVDYIQKNLEAGYHKDAIKKVLLEAGHEISEVEGHIRHVLGSQPNANLTGKIKLDFGANAERNFIIALIVIGAIVISLTSFNYFFGPDKGVGIPSAGLGAVSSPEEDLNLLNKALIRNDQAICDEIQDADLMEQCKGKFILNLKLNETCDEECGNKKIFNLAIIKNNESLCAGITNESSRQNCLGFFDKPLVNETEKICDERCKDQELLNLALIKHNSSICLQISDSSLKSQCEENLG